MLNDPLVRVVGKLLLAVEVQVGLDARLDQRVLRVLPLQNLPEIFDLEVVLLVDVGFLDPLRVQVREIEVLDILVLENRLQIGIVLTGALRIAEGIKIILLPVDRVSEFVLLVLLLEFLEDLLIVDSRKEVRNLLHRVLVDSTTLLGVVVLPAQVCLVVFVPRLTSDIGALLLEGELRELAEPFL